ncbi:MAG: methyltransferase domain-containing protein [Simkaniaceae bacterium]|nr:methyltransferase domain-containing protein [Simkaniaceae bacterium]
MDKLNIYQSGKVHNSLQASKYSKTLQSPHRFLAYRDFSHLIRNFTNIHRVLDFGSGAGASTQFLCEKGYDVIGIDKSPAMIKEAKLTFPLIEFVEIEKLKSLSNFDMVFSSFVLFELASHKEICNYLSLASSVLKEDGIFFGITGSEYLHQKEKKWKCFNVNYKENTQLISGNIVKLGLTELDIEFYDYYWKEDDYRECFNDSNLELMQVYYPLGNKKENISWKDELITPPFVIFLAKKTQTD